MRRFDGRLKRLEQARSRCPGCWKIEMYRCYRGAEDRLPEPDNRCLLCGLEHEPAGESWPVRRIIIVIPEGHEDDSIGPEGWRREIERGEEG
jgi:hypothetical protein